MPSAELEGRRGRIPNTATLGEKVTRSISELKAFLKESYSTTLSNQGFEAKLWAKDLLVKPSLGNMLSTASPD